MSVLDAISENGVSYIGLIHHQEQGERAEYHNGERQHNAVVLLCVLWLVLPVIVH